MMFLGPVSKCLRCSICSGWGTQILILESRFYPRREFSLLHHADSFNALCHYVFTTEQFIVVVVYSQCCFLFPFIILELKIWNLFSSSSSSSDSDSDDVMSLRTLLTRTPCCTSMLLPSPVAVKSVLVPGPMIEKPLEVDRYYINQDTQL